jgi:hypothetical protein
MSPLPLAGQRKGEGNRILKQSLGRLGEDAPMGIAWNIVRLSVVVVSVVAVIVVVVAELSKRYPRCGGAG